MSWCRSDAEWSLPSSLRAIVNLDFCHWTDYRTAFWFLNARWPRSRLGAFPVLRLCRRLTEKIDLLIRPNSQPQILDSRTHHLIAASTEKISHFRISSRRWGHTESVYHLVSIKFQSIPDDSLYNPQPDRSGTLFLVPTSLSLNLMRWVGWSESPSIRPSCSWFRFTPLKPPNTLLTWIQYVPSWAPPTQRRWLNLPGLPLRLCKTQSTTHNTRHEWVPTGESKVAPIWLNFHTIGQCEKIQLKWTRDANDTGCVNLNLRR